MEVGGEEGRKDGGRTENKRVKRIEEEGEKNSHHIQNHTAMKTVKDSNMEVVRQVLSKAVSGNWEKGDQALRTSPLGHQQHWAGCQGQAQEVQGLG